MSKPSGLGAITRGGQFVLHDLRMGLPVLQKLLGLGVVVFLAVFLGLMAHSTSRYERYVVGQYVWAEVMVAVMDPQGKTMFKEADGREVPALYTAIIRAPVVQAVVAGLEGKMQWAFKRGLGALCLVYIALGIGLWQWGRRGSRDRLIKGDRLAKAKHRIKRTQLQLAKVCLPANSECGHLLFHGTTGTGKSTAIKSLLDQIRLRGDRAIIYDKSCNYLEEFYQSSDVLLNPLDTRSRGWDLWAECRDAADFDSVAAAQIPASSSSQDPFWIQAARTLFSATAFKMRGDRDCSIQGLLHYLLNTDLETLQGYLKGTVAESLVSEKIAKASLSIKAVLANSLKSLRYMDKQAVPFSIRQWIQAEGSQHWLFITSLGDRHETLKPLISTWLDIAVNALLSLPPNQTRRIWLILDELASLQPLPYLTATLSESRKFGGCVVVGIQNIAQLEKVYGAAGARDISALLNTRVLFREPDPAIAKWSAQNCGEQVVEEYREGGSLSTQALQESDSFQRQETRKPLISFSEIMQLPNLQAYLRLPGNEPIQKVQFRHRARLRRNTGFIGRSENGSSPEAYAVIPSTVDDLSARLPQASEG